MNEDFSELIQYLDGKFTKIDKKFEEVDQKFKEVGGRFESVDSRFENISQKIIDIDGKLENILENKADKSDINNLMNAVDAYAKKADTYFQEMLMIANKVDRHEKWLHQVAEKLGIKLEY